MKPKLLVLWGVLLVLYVISQQLVWNEQKYDYVNNYMFSYTTPRMRRFLSAGHGALVSNLALIRGIQFYGMNYPLFDKKPVMYEQYLNLADAAVQLDPRFTEAYRFWGFGLTSAERGKSDSFHLLMAGARRLSATSEKVDRLHPKPAFYAVQPSLWKVAKDAGYIAQYELKNATPEWTVEAYRLALLSPDCPEFINRLMILAKAHLFPDPMIPILDLAEDFNRASNEAIRELNLSHIRRLIAEEHKRFWDFAQEAHIEIHGATPTRIGQLAGDVRILKTAFERYSELSKGWTHDGKAQLFPNLVNPKPGPTEKLAVQTVTPPQLPQDPHGGKYLILEVLGKPRLLGTGLYEEEREGFLGESREALRKYQEKHAGACPDDLEAFYTEVGFRLLEADGLGYAPLLDRENCRFFFPPISEEEPPTLPPYGEYPEEEEAPSSRLMPPKDVMEQGAVRFGDELSPPPIPQE